MNHRVLTVIMCNFGSGECVSSGFCSLGSRALDSLYCIVMYNFSTLNKALLTDLFINLLTYLYLLTYLLILTYLLTYYLHLTYLLNLLTYTYLLTLTYLLTYIILFKRYIVCLLSVLSKGIWILQKIRNRILAGAAKVSWYQKFLENVSCVISTERPILQV